MKVEIAAGQLESLGSPVRLKIYRALVRAGGDGLPVGDLQAKVGLAASTLSHHVRHLREAGLIAGSDESSVQAMVALMDEGQLAESLDIARRLRAAGINTEVQMESRKLAKQFQYASRAGIRFVVLAGEDELARGVVTVKDLLREQQFDVKREELASSLKVELEQARALAGR